VRPALLFVDIDKFRNANAAFGLVVGDSLLLTVARRLARNLGPQDTLARVGGDQFALLLLSQSDPRELAMLAEAVRRSLRAPISIAGQDVVLTASIGISIYDGPDEDPAELLREAEIAMYRAKRGGTDRIEIFSSEMRTEKGGRLELEGDLRKAIEKKQLKLLYQPIFYLPTETLAGFEALVRWEHPTLGTLNPGEFIPIAEESDLIEQLGSFVLSRAVQEAARWQKELSRPDNPVFVSVNVSSRQLFKPDLVNEVRHILARAVLPKGSLRLEITESLAMENPEKATAVLRQLADAGAGLSLDDFGTGYSSLSYLNQFTFDTIKLDKSFIAASGQDGTGSTILRSVVALSHELGKKVVAEGVETEDDVVFLRSIGCEFGQGFYYSEPMNDRDVMQLLRVARKAERRIKKSLLRKRFSNAEQDDVDETPVDNTVPFPAQEQQPRQPMPGNGAEYAARMASPPGGMPMPPQGQSAAYANAPIPQGIRPNPSPAAMQQAAMQQAAMQQPGLPPVSKQQPGSYVPPPLPPAPQGMVGGPPPPPMGEPMPVPYTSWPVASAGPSSMQPGPGAPSGAGAPPLHTASQVFSGDRTGSPTTQSRPVTTQSRAPAPPGAPPFVTTQSQRPPQPAPMPPQPTTVRTGPPTQPPGQPAGQSAGPQGAPPVRTQTQRLGEMKDMAKLPTNIAESLAKLAGRRSTPPPPRDADGPPPAPAAAAGGKE
jgi:diguanylate cyclase (GGDEF)-like protein